ncbi:3-dehydrosphinganine reductase [Entamoeba marina]
MFSYFFDFPLILLTVPLFISLLIFVSFVVVLVCGGFAYLYKIYSFKRNIPDFKGKHVLLFGGSAGVGQAIAYHLAKQGVHLSIASRTKKRLEETKYKCLSLNSNTTCDIYECDMKNSNDVKNVINQSFEKNGVPHLMINSAGIAHPLFIEDCDYEQYVDDMNLNYFGCLRMLKETKTYLDDNDYDKKQKIDIVCVGSVLGLMGSIGYSSYSPTKYAMKGLVDSLRFEFLGSNIHLHYFAPANMDTPGFEIENKNKPKLVRDVEDNVSTLTAEQAAKICLMNLDNYVITTEPDLELLKNSTPFMNEFNLSDIIIAPLASIAIYFYRKSIESNIFTNIDTKKD